MMFETKKYKTVLLLINIKNLPFHYPVLHYQKYLQITLENSRIFNQTLSCSQKRENTAFLEISS